MLSNLIFDVIIILVLAIAGFIGVKVGFFNILAKPFKYVGAIVITLGFAKPFGNGVIYPMIYKSVSNKVSTFLLAKFSAITEATVEELPTLIKFAASLWGLDINTISGEAGTQSLIQNIIDKVMDPVVGVISIVIGGIVLYILSKLLLGLALWLVNSVLDNGAIGVVNKTLGCIFTLIIAFVIVWAVVGCSDFIINIPVIHNTKWGSEFTGGIIYRFFKNLSIVDLLLSF